MDFSINNEQEIAQIKCYLNVTIEEVEKRRADDKYEKIKNIVDKKMALIADEMHLIMSTYNHKDNFMSGSEAWDFFKDSVVSGPTIMQDSFDIELFKLANRVSKQLNHYYIKGMNYFYRGDNEICRLERDELVLDELTGWIDWGELNQIQDSLSYIAETELALEEKVQDELQEEEEERKERELILHCENKGFTRNIKANIHTIIKKLRLPDRDGISIAEELSTIINLQEKKLENYGYLLEIDEERGVPNECSSRTAEIKKDIYREEQLLTLYKNSKEANC